VPYLVDPVLQKETEFLEMHFMDAIERGCLAQLVAFCNSNALFLSKGHDDLVY
jgi:hypothetical protein